MRRYYLTLGLVLAIISAFFLASPRVQAGATAAALPAATASATPPPAAGVSVSTGFVQRTIVCTVSVFSEPDVNFATADRIKAGQRWFVNSVAVKGKDNRSWTEIYVSGPYNGYIPTSCVASY
jgi:hypothetical protein